MSYLNTPIPQKDAAATPQVIVYQAPPQKVKKFLYIALFFLASALVNFGLMGYFISQMVSANKSGMYVSTWGHHHYYSNGKSYYQTRVAINASAAGISLIIAIIFLVKYKKS